MPLPIEKSLPELKKALAENNRVVLQAPPGSGKSTIVAPTLLEAAWLKGKKIILLQPRRVAARSIAARMAELRTEELGQTIGYRIRFEKKISEATKIEVITEGILTRMLQEDSALEDVGLIIFDEFHERSIHADLALALALEIQDTIRSDLRLLIMSATLDSASLKGFLGTSAVVTGEGVPYPVEIRYLSDDPTGRISDTAGREILRALREDEGDILVFLPGVGEIKQTRDKLAAVSEAEVTELYGDQSYEEQKRALFPNKQGRRKIILSTPIAETSLTIEGVRTVIDSGYMKSAKFDASYGINRLVTERISQDSGEQRAGRAGRLGPGICRRLWSEHTQRTLRKSRTPEILESDLSSLMLELSAWGVSDPAKVRFLDQPRPADWQRTRELLCALNAVDGSGAITARGRELANIATHPRLAALLLEARARGELPLACDIVAILEERDLFRRDDRVGADIEERIHALRGHRRKERSAAVDSNQCFRVDRVAKEWCRRFSVNAQESDPKAGDAGVLLSFAYPERIAKRREAGGRRYILASGAGATLGEHDRLSKAEFIVAAHMHAGSGDGKIFLAAEIEREALEIAHSEKLAVEDRVSWDTQSESVREQENIRLGALIIESRNSVPPREMAEPILIEQVLESGGVNCFDWSSDAEQLRARVLLAARLFPEKNFPDFSDEALNCALPERLPMFLESGTRMSEVRAVSAQRYLESLLQWEQRKMLDEELPLILPLPSGKGREISYGAEQPVLAAIVQELFGWNDTPRLAGGRVSLTLEILSPARRPVQVTRDLRGFWQGTYRDVRKELRGRYPKHPWPEEGIDAPPVLKRGRNER